MKPETYMYYSNLETVADYLPNILNTSLLLYYGHFCQLALCGTIDMEGRLVLKQRHKAI